MVLSLLILPNSEEPTYLILLQSKTWVFPEGTKNKIGKILLPFKSGGFAVALSAQVSIIPVVHFQKGQSIKPYPNGVITL